LKARGAQLVLASVGTAPHVDAALRDAGVIAAVTHRHVFADADRALEWAETHLIEAVRASASEGGEYPFVQLDLLAGFSAPERAAGCWRGRGGRARGRERGWGGRGGRGRRGAAGGGAGGWRGARASGRRGGGPSGGSSGGANTGGAGSFSARAIRATSSTSSF